MDGISAVPPCFLHVHTGAQSICLTRSYVITYCLRGSEMQLRRETEELSELKEACSR